MAGLLQQRLFLLTLDPASGLLHVVGYLLLPTPLLFILASGIHLCGGRPPVAALLLLTLLHLLLCSISLPQPIQTARNSSVDHTYCWKPSPLQSNSNALMLLKPLPTVAYSSVSTNQEWAPLELVCDFSTLILIVSQLWASRFWCTFLAHTESKLAIKLETKRNQI